MGAEGKRRILEASLGNLRGAALEDRPLGTVQEVKHLFAIDFTRWLCSILVVDPEISGKVKCSN